MTAKEKQTEVIKSFLKPCLKQHGYSNSGLNWWIDRGDFYKKISLQNFSWNTRDDVTFCFNIDIILKLAAKSGEDPKPPKFDIATVSHRTNFFLPDTRKTGPHKNNTGYIINDRTELQDFIGNLRIDMESGVLPALDKLKALNDCVAFYQHVPFWGERLKKKIEEHFK